MRRLVKQFLNFTGRTSPDKASRHDLLGGFGVTDDEAARLLVDPSQAPAPDGEAGLLRAHIDARVMATHETGVSLPLGSLFESFSLGPLSRQLLTLALCAEVDEGIRRLFMYTWNDFTRRRPTLEFLLGLIQPTTAGRLLNVDGFFFTSPLLKWNLVSLDAEGADEPFLGRTVRLRPSVVSWALGGSDLDPSLVSVATVVREASRDSLVIPPAVREPLDRNLARVGTPGAPVMVIIGPAGVGKSTIARQHLLGLSGLVIEVHVDTLVHPPSEANARLSALRRDARLLRAPIIADLADAESAAPELLAAYRQLADILDEHAYGAVVTARDRASWFVSLLTQALQTSLPLPSKEDRIRLWQSAFDRGDAEPDDEVIESSARYPLSGGSIQRAARAALAAGMLPGAAVRFSDVTDACRAQLTPRLSGIAKRIVTSFTLDDLIIPAEGRTRLDEVIAYARHHNKVFFEWGYDRLLPYGRGLSVLFSGPPGTGKTMAAGIIGGILGMEVFRIDLSQTVSKYIGETEKNLGRIFDEATKSESILLFDEADSLFSKRTSVKSSVDRYANLEVNYLLQRMEDFEGVTILTTNFEGSLDDAFRRRIRFRVNFPAPDEGTRERLWRSMVPEAVERAEDIDFEDLATSYDLSGGHIKNAALRAAFFAAAATSGLRNEHLHLAARLECEKLGQVVRAYDGDS